MTIQTMRYSCLGWNFPFNVRNTELYENIVGTVPTTEADGSQTSLRFVVLGNNKARLDMITTEIDGNTSSSSTIFEGKGINTAGPEDRIWRWVSGKEK
jgi:hypothetical protein